MGKHDSISQYRIELAKPNPVYFAGEWIFGTLHLVTTKPIDCRGLRLELKGKSHCQWTTGSGDNKTEHIGDKTYAYEKHTLWGDLFKTVIIDNAGSDAYFGVPWAPLEGLLNVPVAPGQSMILRVMDYDWGKKDDLLGEVAINDVDDLIAQCSDSGSVTLQLMRKGKPQGQSTITVTVNNAPPGEMHSHIQQADGRLVRVIVVSCNNLRKADLIGKNDVYVQSYCVSTSILKDGSSLPEPAKTITLPPTTFAIPFSLQLPATLPSSLELNHRNFVRYSLFSHIDIAWKRDPSCRQCITVIEPLPSALPHFLEPVSGDKEQQGHPRCCCCVLSCIDKGLMRVEASIDRTGFSPGEAIRIQVKAQNGNSEKNSVLKVVLKRRVKCTSRRGTTTTIKTNYVLHQQKGGPGESIEIDTVVAFPNVPPCFHGLSTAGQRNNGMLRKCADPIIWCYDIDIEFVPDGCGSIGPCFPITVTAIPLTTYQPDPTQFAQQGYAVPPPPPPQGFQENIPPPLHDAWVPMVKCPMEQMIQQQPTIAATQPVNVADPEEDLNSFSESTWAPSYYQCSVPLDQQATASKYAYRPQGEAALTAPSPAVADPQIPSQLTMGAGQPLDTSQVSVSVEMGAGGADDDGGEGTEMTENGEKQHTSLLSTPTL